MHDTSRWLSKGGVQGDGERGSVVDQEAIGALQVGGDPLEGQGFCLHIQGVAGRRWLVKVTSGKDIRGGLQIGDIRRGHFYEAE